MKNLMSYPLFVLFLAPIILFGQGTLSGTIIDEGTGETLIGANVVIQGTTIGTSTDFDGKYQFDAEPGTYNISVSYIGFNEKIVEEVIITDGETTFLDVAMSDNTVELDLDIVVKAKVIERSENSILLLQKRSEKIQDGISSQEMSRYSLGSAAAAMTKVTGATVQDGKYVYVRGLGDRYSLSQLNGLLLPSIDPYRNSAQLDLIPTNLLENIITAKTFTPDQPGTFTGGNLDIKTKSFPERQTLKISGSVGYNTVSNLNENFLTYEGGDLDWLGYGIADREIPGILFDPKFSGFLDQNAELQAFLGNEEAARAIDQVVDEFDFTFVPNRERSGLDHGLSISYGNNYEIGEKSQLGIIFSGSYKRSYQFLEDAQKNRWILFDINSSGLQNRGLYNNDNSSDNPVVNGLAGVAFKFDDFNSIDLKVLYNHNTDKGADIVIGEDGQNIEAPDEKRGRALLYKEREMINYQLTGKHVLMGMNETKIEWAGSIVNATLDEPNLRFFTGQYNAQLDREGLPLSNVNDPFFFWRDLKDDIVNGKVDITFPFGAKTTGNKFKVGGFYSFKERDFNEYRYINATSPNAERFAGDFDAFFAPSNMGIISETDNSFVIGNFINEATRPENSYVGDEMVTAVYGMITYGVTEKLKFVGGARYETTDINVESKAETLADSLRIGKIDKGNFLPSLNLIYSLTEDMNIRASYTQTIARPNLREIAPFSAFDPLIDEFYIGNNKLTTTDIQNMDLRWEWFIKPGEILAVSGFYKNFDNPIAQQYLRSSNPEIQFNNVENGFIYGLEFEFRKDLDFLGGIFQYMRMSTNFAIIDSEMDVTDQTGLEPDSRPFEGQAPFIANFNLNYDNPDSELDVTLAYNYVGDKLALIGREGVPDIFDRERHTLDATIRKKFGRVGISISGKNLLDYRYLRSNEFKGTEFVFSRFNRGVSFGLGVSYDVF